MGANFPPNFFAISALDGSSGSKSCLGALRPDERAQRGVGDASGRRRRWAAAHGPCTASIASASPAGSPREMSRQSCSCCRESWSAGSPVKSSRRHTPARAGGRRGRSARCGGGSPDSAGGARVRPRACGDGCVGGSALRRGPRVSDDRRCRTSRRTATRRRRSHPAAGVIERLFGSACVSGHVLKTRRNDRVVRVERRRRIGTAGRLKAALWESEDSEPCTPRSSSVSTSRFAKARRTCAVARPATPVAPTSSTGTSTSCAALTMSSGRTGRCSAVERPGRQRCTPAW